MTNKLLNRFTSNLTIGDECWEWQGGLVKGYGVIHFDNTTQYAHRVAYRLFNGDIDDGLHVLHHCDNPKCVNPTHLWLGTNADNVADRVAKGRSVGGGVKGEKHYRAEFTDEQKLEMIRLLDSGMKCKEVAHIYGTNLKNVSQIYRRYLAAIKL